MTRKQMFKYSCCLVGDFIYLLDSIHEGDGVEDASLATRCGPAELYCFPSHILNFYGYWHCKVKMFHAAERDLISLM